MPKRYCSVCESSPCRPGCPEPEPEEIEQGSPYDYVDYSVIERDFGHLLP